MKKIIMFEGDIETQGYFSRQMKKEFEELGYAIYLYDLRSPWKSSMEMLAFIEKGNTVVLSFNFHGMCGEPQFKDEKGVYIWDELQIPCYNILADHPYYYYNLLSTRPERYIQISIDKNHEAFMKRFFPEIELGRFLPLGGTRLIQEKQNGISRVLPIEQREYDVVFTGNYASPKRFEKYITRLDEEYTKFYYEIIEDLFHNPFKTIEEAVEEHIRMEIPEVSEGELKQTMQNITFLDLYVRYDIRGKVVKQLVDNGIKVHVFGDKWGELNCKHPENLINGDSLFSEECLHKIANSKISLNVMPWFKYGAHDRVFNSMLNGAVCLTDSNPFMDGFLKDHVNAAVFQLTELEKIPEIAAALLSNPDKMQLIADQGCRMAQKDHTWAKRAEEFLRNLPLRDHK